MINNYIHYIVTGDGWLYCDHFKGKKLSSFKCNMNNGLVKHRFNSPLTSKANFFKICSRSFSKYALQSSKNQNYLDICKASEIIFLIKKANLI